MQEVLVNTPITIGTGFVVGGTATNPSPDSATVTITREDGTALVTAANATDAGTGVFTYTLTAAQNNQLDILKAVWTSSNLGLQTTYHEIVGAFLFPVGDLDVALNRAGNAADYTFDQKHAARTVATRALEHALGEALVPRYGRKSVDGGDSSGDLRLGVVNPLTITSISVNGTAFTQDELDGVEIYPRGILYRSGGWTVGRRNVVVKYTHGHLAAPADAARAGVLLAAHLLADGPWDDRGFSINDDAGLIRLLTAGVSGAMFSIPDVQALVNRRRYVVTP